MKTIEKIISYGLYLLVFILPLQTRWIIRYGELNGGYFEYGTRSLYAVDVLLVSLLILFLVFKFKQKTIGANVMKMPVLWGLVGALELIIFVSIFFAPDKMIAICSYIKLLFGIGLFWLIMHASYSHIKLVYAFLAGIAIQACIGIWQFFTQTGFSSKWLGMAEHLPETLGTSVVQTLNGERWLRAYGELDHPNMLGGLIAIGFILLVIIISRSQVFEKSPSKNIQSDKETWQSVWHFALVVLFSYGLFFSFSRSAWSGFLIGLLVLLALSLYRNDAFKQIRLLQTLLIIVVLFSILGLQNKELLVTRVSGQAPLEEKSTQERMESIHLANVVIKDNWLFGTGIGNYTQYVYQNIDSTKESWYYQPVHNAYLLVLAEIGIMGLAIFVGLMLYAFYRLIQNVKLGITEDIYYIALLAALTVMFMFDHLWLSLHFGMLLMWLILGLICRDKNVTLKSQIEY